MTNSMEFLLMWIAFGVYHILLKESCVFSSGANLSEEPYFILGDEGPAVASVYM